MSNDQIETMLKRIDKKLSTLLTEKKAIQWVKAGEVSKLTGWNKEGMRRARERKYVMFEKRADGFWYNLNSIAEIFLIKQS